MRFKPEIANLPLYNPPKLPGQQTSITKLSANENPLGPSPKAVAAMRAAVESVYRYPDGGSLALREALATRAGLTPDMVTCSNSSDEMVMLLSMGFLGPGDEAVMAEGTFISYLMYSKQMGATPVRVPMSNYTHDLDAMVDAITPRTRLLFVCNPNNPTGTISHADDVRRLLQRVPDDVLIVMDEAYVDFVERADYPDLLPELRDGRRNLVLLRTFAKIHGLAGLRLGYTYAHPDIVSYLDRARPTFNVNLMAQVAGLAALDDAEHIERSRAHANKSRAFYERELRALGLEPAPSYTNFIAFPVGNDLAVSDQLRARGFIVTPISGWGVPGCIRVSFGTDEENTRFISALREVLSVN